MKKLPFFLLLPAILCGCPTVGHGEFDVAAYLDGAPGTKVRLSYTEQDGASEDGRSNRLTEKEAEDSVFFRPMSRGEAAAAFIWRPWRPKKATPSAL